MIVWRNSKKEITHEDLERNAKAIAKEHGQRYMWFDSFPCQRHIELVITCEHGRKLTAQILCDYYFPEDAGI